MSGIGESKLVTRSLKKRKNEKKNQKNQCLIAKKLLWPTHWTRWIRSCSKEETNPSKISCLTFMFDNPPTISYLTNYTFRESKCRRNQSCEQEKLLWWIYSAFKREFAGKKERKFLNIRVWNRKNIQKEIRKMETFSNLTSSKEN